MKVLELDQPCVSPSSCAIKSQHDHVGWQINEVCHKISVVITFYKLNFAHMPLFIHAIVRYNTLTLQQHLHAQMGSSPCHVLQRGHFLLLRINMGRQQRVN